MREAVAIEAVRDVIGTQSDDDDEDETRSEDEDDPAPLPQPLIQLQGMTPNRFDPVVDEPVTGAGNDDLWEQPTPPAPGG